MRRTLLLPVLLAGNLLGQTATLTDLEKEFQDSLAGVVMEGHSTRDDKPGVSDDKYNIEKVEKSQGDSWIFHVRLQMQGKEVTVPMPIDVKWAGDTPVITLTERALPMGSYTARVVVYKGHYAGTWSGKSSGGKIFGRIVKKEIPDIAKPVSTGP